MSAQPMQAYKALTGIRRNEMKTKLINEAK
jgi:hypothetical protein